MEALILHSSQSWEQALAEYDYSLFSSPRWIEALASPALQPLYIDFMEDDRIVAKLAGFSMGRKGTIRRKMYFYAGPALVHAADSTLESKSHSHQDNELLARCYKALIELARKSGYQRVIQLSYDYRHVIPDLPHMKFRPRKEYSIALDFPPENLNKQVSRNIRRNVGKARDAGYVVEKSTDPGFVDEFIHLLGETRSVRISKGREEYRSLFLENLSEETLHKLTASGLLLFYVAKKESQVEGALGILLEDRKAYGFLKGSVEGGYELGIPTLLDFAAMEDLQQQGYAYLNLGGVPGGPSRKGLHEYKQKLGCQPVEGADGASVFLRFPFSMLNLLVQIAKKLPKNTVTQRFSEIW